MPEDEVHEQRLKHIKPILERYWEHLGSISAVGGSNLDKAVNYSLNNRRELEMFLLDPFMPWDKHPSFCK
ncbi:transposase IS66 [Eubacterium sp. CAG:786]|nr:transposase IS66 [Eubacterium sp. CAG:786]